MSPKPKKLATLVWLVFALAVFAGLGAAGWQYMFRIQHPGPPDLAFETMTSVTADGDVQAHETGWGDYQGWFRTQLSREKVQRVVAYFQARKVEDRSRRECTAKENIMLGEPAWWVAQPDIMGSCWVTAKSPRGGATLHYDAETRTVTLLIYTL